MSSKFKSGISLVEMLIAMAILSIMGSAVVLITLQLMVYSLSTRLKNQSVTFAEQAQEQVRGFYQTNGWAVLCPKASGGANCSNGTTCYTDGNLATALVDCAHFSSLATPFSQQVSVSYNISQQSQVAITITVQWTDRGQPKSTILQSYYYSY